MTATTYVWRRLDLEGLDLVRLDTRADGVSAEGYEVCTDGAEHWAVRFTAELGGGWGLHRTSIEAVDGAGVRSLELSLDAGGSWTRDRRPDPSLDGCTVVDIAGNPFTNAFVTRHFVIDVGDEMKVRAAYVEPPGLLVRPLVQRYRRLEPDRWRYADDDYGTFELTTDADGIALDYERLAGRLGPRGDVH